MYSGTVHHHAAITTAVILIAVRGLTALVSSQNLVEKQRSVVLSDIYRKDGCSYIGYIGPPGHSEVFQSLRPTVVLEPGFVTLGKLPPLSGNQFIHLKIVIKSSYTFDSLYLCS